jgi:hypothetical protein
MRTFTHLLLYNILFASTSGLDNRFTLIILSHVRSSILSGRGPAVQVTHVTALAIAVWLMEIARGAAGMIVKLICRTLLLVLGLLLVMVLLLKHFSSLLDNTIDGTVLDSSFDETHDKMIFARLNDLMIREMKLG